MAQDWQALTALTGGRTIEVERVRLVHENVAVEGRFELPPLAQLEAEDQVFVAAFVRSHGSIKEMERLFGVSYPTIKNRLNRIGNRLPSVEVGPPAAAAAGAPPEAAASDPKFLRIEVHKAARDSRPEKTVNIRVPFAMVRSGMRLGALVPGTGDRIQDALKDRGLDVDWSKLDQAGLATLLKSLGELTVDVDDGRAQLKITAE